MRSPSKKIAPIILACIIAVGSITYAATYSTESKKNTSQQEEVALIAVKSNSIQSNLREVDADNDGLKDWEESLWKSNPRNNDTDGDNTSDGEEIDQGRNPLVKGPGDEITLKQQTEIITESNPITTKTNIIARELFATYVDIKRSGGDLSEEIENQIIESTLLASDLNLNKAKIYSKTDIKIIQDTSTATLKNYANNMGSITRKHNTGLQDNEFTLLSKAVITRNGDDLDKIDIIVESYKNIIADALQINVPQELASYHLDFINGLSVCIEADMEMKKVFEDAASSLVGLKQYQQASIATYGAYASIIKYYSDQNITFSANEDGYGFLNMTKYNY